MRNKSIGIEDIVLNIRSNRVGKVTHIFKDGRVQIQEKPNVCYITNNTKTLRLIKKA